MLGAAGAFLQRRLREPSPRQKGAQGPFDAGESANEPVDLIFDDHGDLSHGDLEQGERQPEVEAVPSRVEVQQGRPASGPPASDSENPGLSARIPADNAELPSVPPSPQDPGWAGVREGLDWVGGYFSNGHVAGMVFDDLSDEEQGPEGDARKDDAAAHAKSRMVHDLYTGPNGRMKSNTLKVESSKLEMQQLLLPEPEPEADVVEGSERHFLGQLRSEEGGILQLLLRQKPLALVLGFVLVAALVTAIAVSVVTLRGPAEVPVHAVMTVRGIDYQLLVSDDALHRNFVSQLRSALWASTRVPEDGIDVEIAQGSVHVRARLRTPEDVDPREFVSSFPSADVRATVVAAVRATSNIQSCSVGPVDVDDMRLLVGEPAGNDPASPHEAAGSAGPDLTFEDHTVTSTTLTSVNDSVGKVAFEGGAGKGAWAAFKMAPRAAPYRSGETIDLPDDKYTELRVSTMEEKFQRCALIGASPLLKGRGHGQDIDSFDIVIRVNRVPTEEYFEDFGQRTDILYSNAMAMYTGEVTLMGNGDDVTTHNCTSSQCDYLAMVFRGDYGCDFEKLQKAWGEEATFALGCTTRSVTKAAYGFQLLESVEPTSGFMAFLTFAPLCHEFVLYGFAGDGAVDGHTEWKGHSLFYEHRLLHWIEEGKWDKIEIPESREWLLKHLPAGPDGMPAVRVVQN